MIIRLCSSAFSAAIDHVCIAIAERAERATLRQLERALIIDGALPLGTDNSSLMTSRCSEVKAARKLLGRTQLGLAVEAGVGEATVLHFSHRKEEAGPKAGGSKSGECVLRRIECALEKPTATPASFQGDIHRKEGAVTA
jgi:hypothetical protein